MRIARLSLEFFGRFTDHSFDFGSADGPSDFHVIYGPNEAGKTTTMEGFLRLLYGFPTREPYDFQHQRKNLKVSGVLELGGAQRSFTRLPTRAGTLLDGGGTIVPEQALSAHLGGLAIEDYRSLLCLDDDTIEKGGEDIANARGDIGRLLFSAAAGISDLSTVLDAARAEADMLYRKRASSTRMALLKKDLAEVERSIREKDVTAGAWQKRKDAVRQGEGAEREAREARDALRNRAAWVAAQRRVLPDLHEHEDLSAEIAPFAAYPDRLDLNPEDLVALTAAQGKAEADIARLTAAIADAETARDAIVFDDDGPALAEALDGLDTLRSRMRTADLDLPKRRQTASEAYDDMARVVRDLGAPDTADPAHLVVAPAEIARLEQLLEEARTADLARETEAAEVADLQARLRAANDTSATLRDETPAPTGLRDLLVRFEADALAPDVARAQDALDAANTHFAEALDALSTEEQSWTELPARPLSPHEAAELAAEHTKLAAQIDSAQEKLADYEDEIRVKAALRAGMAEAEGVIGDAEARQAREERDALWQVHRVALSGDTADAFRHAADRVDAMAEGRLAQASALGQLRQLEQDRVTAETRAKLQQEALVALRTKAATVTARAAEAAKSIGLPSADPAALHAWIDAHEKARQAGDALDKLAERHTPTLDKAHRLLEALKPLLPLEDPSFTAALAMARRLAEEERAHEDQVKSAAAAVRSLTKDLADRKNRLATRTEAADGAGQAWAKKVAELFGGALDPETLAAAPGALRELREHDAKRLQATRSVTAMEADQSQFRAAIAPLAARIGIDPTNPLAAFDALRAHAETDAKARAERARLSQVIATDRQARHDASVRLSDIARKVETLGAQFPSDAETDTIEALRRTVGVAQWVIDTRSRVAALASRVRTELSVPDMTAARAALSDATATDLDAQAATIEADLERAEARLSQAIEARVTATRDLAEITGDAEVAELVERRANLQLELEDTALEYLERAFGLRLADEAIRRYRDAHRGAMLEATERAFADLTNGAYPRLATQTDGQTEHLVAIDTDGGAKQVGDMSKGTRFQLYLALRAAAYEQMAGQGIRLPFFCDDIFETFDEDRTRAACRLMERIGRSGQAIYLTHHRHVVEIARDVCDAEPRVHML